MIIDDAEDGSEFTEDNASTTETEDTKASEDIEDMEEEGLDGVSSEGEKTSGGTETVEVRFNMFNDYFWSRNTPFVDNIVLIRYA